MLKSELKLVVSDTGPISSLIRLDLLRVLPQLFHTVFIPVAVVNELMDFPDFVSVNWQIAGLQIVEVEQIETVLQLRSMIDAGEAAAITYALNNPVDYLLIDEMDGRRVADDYGLPTMGTLGVILRAKEYGYIDRVKPHLERLVEIGFYISRNLYAHVLNLSNEQ